MNKSTQFIVVEFGSIVENYESNEKYPTSIGKK
jgi:hypothetical protein